MAYYTPDYSGAIKNGIKAFYAMKDYKQRKKDNAAEQDRLKNADTRAQNADQRAQDAAQRQADADARTKEEYEYRKGLRPIQEQGLKLSNDATQASIDASKSSTAANNAKIADANRKIQEENLVDSLKFLKANMPEKAVELYNRGGKDKIVSVEKHPDDPDQKLWIATDKKGDKHVIDPEWTLNQLGIIDPASKNSSANVAYLQFVARNVYGGDMKAAFDAITQGKQKSPQTFARELYGKIKAASPYMTDDEVKQAVDGAMSYSPPGTEQPGAPAGGQSAAPAEGATATNPQTGEKIQFTGGKWVPVQQQTGPGTTVLANAANRGAPASSAVPTPIPTAAAAPASPVEGLKPAAQVYGEDQARQAMATPEFQRQQTADDIANSQASQAADVAARKDRMGVTGATPEATGKQYNEMARAVHNVLDTIHQGVLPDPGDVVLAIQMARGSQDRQLAELLTSLIQKYPDQYSGIAAAR